MRTVSSRGCLLSYSRRGEPGDNAVNEAFFTRLKVEWADVFYEARTFGELQRLVGRAIAYYNEERYHSSLGYRTPLAFMNDFLTSHQQRVQAVSLMGLITPLHFFRSMKSSLVIQNAQLLLVQVAEEGIAIVHAADALGNLFQSYVALDKGGGDRHPLQAPQRMAPFLQTYFTTKPSGYFHGSTVAS